MCEDLFTESLIPVNKIGIKFSICSNRWLDKLWCFNTMDYNGMQCYKWCRRVFKHNNLLLSTRYYKITCIVGFNLRIIRQISKYKTKIMQMGVLTAGIVGLFLFPFVYAHLKKFPQGIILFQKKISTIFKHLIVDMPSG